MISHSHWLRWVFSTSLPANQRSGHTLFDPSKSKNWKALSGYTWYVPYEDGSSASGTVGTDVVTVGGTSVTGQAVEIASKVSSLLIVDTACDGIMGLASKWLNQGDISSRLSFAQPANKFTSETRGSEHILRHSKAESQLPCLYC
jgi:Eukaryotic aspartyl protease